MNTPAAIVPSDLIEARHAARIAKVHVSGIHRWVLKGKLRGWRRVGRLFVSLLWLLRGWPIRRSFEMGLARIDAVTAAR